MYLESMSEHYTIFEAYEALTIEDDRGREGHSIGIFSFQMGAETAAVGRGYFGGDGRVQAVTCIRITATGEVFQLADSKEVELDVDLDKETTRLRESGLAKLSREERRALGLAGD